MTSRWSPRADWRFFGILVACWAVGLLMMAPFYLVHEGFEDYVDVPACQQRCAKEGLGYREYLPRKTGPECVCFSLDGPVIFRMSGNVFGETSANWELADWLVRIFASIVASVLPIALIVLGIRLWTGRRERRGHGEDNPF